MLKARYLCDIAHYLCVPMSPHCVCVSAHTRTQANASTHTKITSHLLRLGLPRRAVADKYNIFRCNTNMKVRENVYENICKYVLVYHSKYNIFRCNTKAVADKYNITNITSWEAEAEKVCVCVRVFDISC